MDVLSRSDVLVQWDYPWNDGGEPVTEFRIEWWSATVNAGAKQAATLHHLDSPRAVQDVNTVSVSAPTKGDNTFLSGTFRVGFDGQWTPELPYDVSAVGMELALRNLSTVEAGVKVSRVLDTNGFTWMVTFAQQKYSGNQFKCRLSALEALEGHKLHAAGDNLLVCPTTQRDVLCVPKLASGIGPSATVGSQQEVQSLTCTGTPSAADGFQLSLLGATTAVIASNANAQALQDALDALAVGTSGVAVRVSIRDGIQTTICAAASPSPVDITFTSLAGDVNALQVVKSAGSLDISVSERFKGQTQTLPGRMAFSFVLSGLSSGNLYRARVAAYNSVGFGAFSDAKPLAGVIPVDRAPSRPRSLSVRSRLSRPTLMVVWETPLTSGNALGVSNYRVEWDVNPSFTSTCGEVIETQTLVVSRSSASVAGKYVLSAGPTATGCLNWQATAADVQGLVTGWGGVYAGAVVTPMGDASAAWDFGYSYSIEFVNAVTTTSSLAKLDISLLTATSGATCGTDLLAIGGGATITRGQYGPGLDDKFGRGRVDGSNNECHAALEEALGMQTMMESVAIMNALSLPALGLALTSDVTNIETVESGHRVLLGANAPVLCASCVQKLAGSALTLTASLASVGWLASGEYFIVEAGTDSSSAAGLRCVMKTVSVTTSGSGATITTTVTIDPADPAFVNGGCQLPTAFEAQAYTLKRFNLRAHGDGPVPWLGLLGARHRR